MKGRTEIPVRHRDSVISRDRQRRGDSRHHFIGHMVPGKEFQLLPSSSEKKRIPAFQPYHTVSFLRLFQKDLVDLFLGHGMSVGAFSHVNQSGGFRDHRKHSLPHQTVIYNYFCLIQDLLPFQSKKPRVSRSCTYQPYFSHLHDSSPFSFDRFNLCASSTPSSSPRETGPLMLPLIYVPSFSL